MAHIIDGPAKVVQHDDIAHRFAFHPADEQRGLTHGSIRARIGAAAHAVADLTPPGREQAVALTKLEEAMMWANAAIARQQEPAAELHPDQGQV